MEADPLLDLRVGHVIDVLRELPAGSVHCAVTSPPYFDLRDYEGGRVGWPDGWVGQLGQEPTPDMFIEHLVLVFREVRRVLRPDGSLWVNIADSYAGMNRGRGSAYKPKDLIGIPWLLAFALRADGWWLRSENIWNKPGGMPESVLDRTSREHEHVFHLTRMSHYYYDTDAVREPYSPDNRRKTTVKAGPGSIQHRDGERWPHPDGKIKRSVWRFATANYPGAHFAVFPIELPETCLLATTSERGACPACGAPWARIVEAEGESVEQRQQRQPAASRALRIAPRADGGALQHGVHVGGEGERKTVGWEPTCACRDAGVAALDGTLSPLAPVPCTVLDPFVGSGTTMIAARRRGRASIGIEVSETYAREETARRLARWWADESRPRELPDDHMKLF